MNIAHYVIISTCQVINMTQNVIICVFHLINDLKIVLAQNKWCIFTYMVKKVSLCDIGSFMVTVTILLIGII